MLLFLATALASPWDALFLTDLAATTTLLRDNHPGPHVDPVFLDVLEEAEQKARAKLEHIEDFTDGARVLTQFANAFEDGHLSLRPILSPSSSRWPGFLTRFDGEQVVVAASTRQDLPNGTPVTSCRGRSALEWLDEDVVPVTMGLPETSSGRTKAAPFWFVEHILATPPTRCVFGGKTLDVTYDHQTPTSKLQAKAWALARVQGSFEITEIDDTFWVRLPTFQPRGNHEAELEAIIEALSGLRASDRIVFDVRGNSGGSSIWGNRIVAALWGQRHAALWTAPLPVFADPTTVTWRASPGNLAYFKGLEDELSGRDERSRRWIKSVLEGLSAAIDKGDPTWVQVNAPQATSDARRPPNPVQGEVLFLTDGLCMSACLDFADRILGMPGVRHVGQETSGDTRYMEVRNVRLPSGAMKLLFAQKAYSNRLRGHNVTYTPPVLYRGDGTTTDLLRHFDSLP